MRRLAATGLTPLRNVRVVSTAREVPVPARLTLQGALCGALAVLTLLVVLLLPDVLASALEQSRR